LIDRLQYGTHRGEGATAEHSVHGRMGLGTAGKGETSRMKTVSIERIKWCTCSTHWRGETCSILKGDKIGRNTLMKYIISGYLNKGGKTILK
jgi:hypothetical protein